MQEPTDAAFVRYREVVEAANAEPVLVRRDFELTEPAETSDEITVLECVVFAIDPQLTNALRFAFDRYASMLGADSEEFEEFRELDRAAYPHLFLGDMLFSLDHAASFMNRACLIPWPQAVAWACRFQMQQARAGLLPVDLEPPGWALAETAYGPLESDLGERHKICTC